MDFLELINKRASVRKFLDKEIAPKDLDFVFQAARLAPTAANRQPVYFKLIPANEIDKIKSVTKYVFNAPLWILVVYDKEQSWKNRYVNEDKGDIDASIVITHMMLAATEVKLGTCWVGSFDLVKAKEVFELDEKYEPVALLPIGYPDPTVPVNPSHFVRDDIKDHFIK